MSISLGNDYSFLFGTSQNSQTSQASQFGAASGAFSLSDYAMIKSGTYKKLMKAYYADNSNSAVNSIAGGMIASKDDSVQIKNLQSSSSALSDSAKALYSDKDNDLFEKGNEDKLLKAVSSFVKDYNATVDAVDKSENDKVIRTGTNMFSNAISSFKMLSSVGITLGVDNKLSLNEDTFKKANASTIKTVFSGAGSFAYRADSYASSINNAAKDDAKKASGTYGASGAYSQAAYGSTYNSYM